MSILLFLIIASIAIYFVPTLVAESRNHKNRRTIFVLNLFFGWSFIGWVLALAWACTYQPLEIIPLDDLSAERIAEEKTESVAS